MSLISRIKSHIVISHKSKPLPCVRLFKSDDDTSSFHVPSFTPPAYKYRDIFLAVAENIRFSSLFAETSQAAKSEEKRMFPQAILAVVHRQKNLHNFRSCTRIFRLISVIGYIISDFWVQF